LLIANYLNLLPLYLRAYLLFSKFLAKFHQLSCPLQIKSSLSILLLALSGITGIAQPTGYSYGKQILIDATQVAGGVPLTNFPLMIRFMGAGADNNLRTVVNDGHVENVNGHDIIFTADEAGTIILDHQVESYNPVTGEYVAWVRIPSLSNSTDTGIFMYYGNCSAADTSTPAVWNTDFDAVYFLHNDFNDATGNGNTATNGGSTDASPGLIGDGQSFVNVVSPGDHVEVPTASISAAQGTVSIWANATSFSANHQYIFGHTTTPPYGNRIQLYVNDATGLLDLGLGDTHDRALDFYDFNTAEWYYVALTWDGTDYTVYVNGTAQVSGTYTGLGTLHTFLDIGNDGNAVARDETWIGDLDHARLSNEVFDADWILTEYNNQRDGAAFYLVGDEFGAKLTFYSFATGAWEANTSWSFAPDGSSGAVPAGVFPRRADNAVIQNGHTITANNVNDNGPCSQSPDNLGLSNVGTFTGSADQMFYHTGDIIISNGGTLTVSEEIMVAGYTFVETGGTFTITEDIVNLGYLEIAAGSTFTNTDDLILSGNSITIIDNTSFGADDIYIDWTDATLCGSGVMNLGNGGADPTVQFFNGGSLNQVCSSFSVTCTSNCGAFPITPTGNFFSGNEGPGGIGAINGTSPLKLWFRVDNGVNTTASNVDSWTNSAGIAALDISETTTQRPALVATAVNGFSEVSFNGSNRLRTGLTLTTSNFVNDAASTFVVCRADNTTQTSSVYMTDPIGANRFSNHIPWSGVVYYDIGDCCNNDSRLDVGGLTGLTGYSVWSYDANPTTGKQLYRNGTQLITRPNSSTFNSHATTRFNLGGNSGLNGFEGDVTETIIYNSTVNTAQRIIIDNYLSAKYGLTLSANNVYAQDDSGNGNYDFDAAGIGQATDGTNHRDSRGTGIVRMWNPNALGDDEFLMWGHDGGALTGTTADVDGALIEERFVRTWRLSESGDVGTVSISFDFNGVGNPLGSNLRLLIDRNGDGFADNDVTPIAGSVSGNVATFSGINFQDGDRFTLGNTDMSSPLPIELLAFSATPSPGGVTLAWKTASEYNNDFFTVEKSTDAEEWNGFIQVDGAGNSQTERNYEITDPFPFSGKSYYRLKQTDFDGTFTHSQIVRVEIDAQKYIKVYPNPFRETLTIPDSQFSHQQLMLYNAIGKSLRLKVKQINDDTVIDTQELPSGVYILRVSSGVTISTFRLIKSIN
jgi:hypothetical protein